MLEADFVASSVVDLRRGRALAVPRVFGRGCDSHADLKHVFCMASYCSDENTLWWTLFEVKEVGGVLY